jgi:glutamine synthetase adenylyltransferase
MLFSPCYSELLRAESLLPDPPTEPHPVIEPIALPPNIPFQDPDKARQNLSRITHRISPALASTLPALLTDAPDPDSGLIFFDRLTNEGSPETVRLLERHPHLAHYAIVVFAHSQFLGETLVRNPDLLASILQEKSLDRSFSRDDFHERLQRFGTHGGERDVSTLLARLKRRQYVRILLRDVLKIAPLAETTAEISALADVLLEGALEEAQRELQRRSTWTKAAGCGTRLFRCCRWASWAATN